MLYKQASQKGKRAPKHTSEKNAFLLYLQSHLQGYVYMEMICYYIRISYMWQNVHVDVCLRYVCNCRHVWTWSTDRTSMYVCTCIQQGVRCTRMCTLYTCLICTLHTYVYVIHVSHMLTAFADIRKRYLYVITVCVCVEM